MVASVPAAHDESRHRLERLEILYEAAHAFAEELDDPGRLPDVIAAACARLVGDFGTVFLVRDDGVWLDWVAAHHADPSIVRDYGAFLHATPLRVGEGVTGTVVATNTPFFLPVVDPATLAEAAVPAYREFVRHLGARSLVIVPMRARGKVLGVISMARSRPGAPYVAADVDMLQDLADRAAMAIDNARLVRQTRAHAHRTQVLAEASREFAEEIADPQRLADAITSACARLVGDFGAVLLRRDDGEWLDYTSAYHTDPGILRDYAAYLRATPVRVGDGIAGKVVQDGEPRFEPVIDPASFVERSVPQFREFARRLNVCSMVAVPMRARGKVLGAVAMSRSRPDAPYTQDDVTVLQDLADRAAMALDNARLLGAVQRALAEQHATRAELEKTQERLRHADKMESVGRLAGGIAHDFNNLLSVVLSDAVLLQRGLPPDDPLQEDVDEIQKAARRLAELTKQLLAFSRQQVLAPRVISLNDVVTDFAKILGRALDGMVELRLRLAPDLRFCRADPGQIEQVLMNLCVNARDAMGGGGQLTIETTDVELDEDPASRPDARRGPHVMLAVADTGTGMADAVLARIFEPFFTTKPVGIGTGLGLATVLGIAEQSGGVVRFTSVLGRGSTFRVYLPVAEKRDDAVASRRGATHAAQPRTGTVLVVDDEEGVRTIVARVLTRAGYEVFQAPSGEDALRILGERGWQVDLVLTDVLMPHMGGPQLAERLWAQRPGAKVLFMSGYTDQAVLENGLLEPHLRFLDKPITPDALLRKVREVLED